MYGNEREKKNQNKTEIHNEHYYFIKDLHEILLWLASVVFHSILDLFTDGAALCHTDWVEPIAKLKFIKLNTENYMNTYAKPKMFNSIEKATIRDYRTD